MVQQKTIFLIALLLMTAPVFATVEWLSVNHVTKELYWAETDREPGFIGWDAIAEGKYDEMKSKYLSMGYTETTFPYKLDLIFVTVIFTVTFLFGSIMQRIKRSRSKE